jgi:hypothetical protein
MTTRSSFSRRHFLTETAGGLIVVGVAGAVFAQVATPQTPAPQQPVPKRPDPLGSSMVQEFVRKAHADLPATQALLSEQPTLLNATWDWGGGDWETALGAAAHMGRRDIALFLLERGARMDVFAAAMLGEVEVVRAVLAAQPAAHDAPGPHGIPLLAHAQAGGEKARAVVELLESAEVSA